MKVVKTHRCTALVATRWHCFLWRNGGFGCHLRVRRRDGLWRHNRLTLFEPVRPRKGRGAWKWEWDSWLTAEANGGSKSRHVWRFGVKSFVRIKVGLGGKPRTLMEGENGGAGLSVDGSASHRATAPLASDARSEAQILAKSSSPAAPSVSVRRQP